MSDDVKVSKGLRFREVALAGVGTCLCPGGCERNGAGFYLAAIRATQRLVVSTSTATGFTQRFTDRRGAWVFMLSAKLRGN